MGFLLHRRPADYLLLLLAGGLLFFVNLGNHSLWDVDESHNAECAREMMVAGDWCVPTFNYDLRTDKPALLYWLMIIAYHCFGVTELAARFWSAVCGLGSLLATYELGRAMFDRRTGLLAGLVLGSAIMFCVSAHAATPDALLIFFTLLTLLVFWRGYKAGRSGWLIWIGVTTGLAVLAKGPVGLALPVTAIGLFLIWERRLRVLLARQLVLGLILFAAVALPWYVLVGVETKWRFFWDAASGQGFFLKHHVGRFMQPLERHGGPMVYHPLALLAGFAPWSAFLGLAVWFGTGRRAWERETRGRGDAQTQREDALPSSYRFLWCWLGVWLLFFSLAGTKLPNYLLPAYPAVALLTARFLTRWQTGQIALSPSWFGVSLACLGLIGLVVGAGLVLASGLIELPLLKGRSVPGLAPWSLAGLALPAAAILAWRALGKGLRSTAVGLAAVVCVGFVALLAGFGPPVVDQLKLPRAFADDIARHQIEPDIQIGCHDFYQPGLVYYTQMRIKRFAENREESIDLLHSPLQTFLLVTAAEWERLAPEVDAPCRVISRRRDLGGNKEILLVTNRLAVVLGATQRR